MFQMEIYVQKLFISTFFLVLRHDFIIHWFYPYRSSNTATDDITNKVTHRIFNTNL